MLFKFMKKILAFFIFFVFLGSATADYNSNFRIQDFKTAQNEGKIVIVHSWNKFCNICAKQKPILENAKKDFKDIIFMNFEQNKNKEIAKFLNIDYWTTIVVYKNNKEIAREIGLYNKDQIYNLIKKGI